MIASGAVELLDGTPVAKRIREEAAALARAFTPPPRLAVILLGERPSGWNWLGIAMIAVGAYLATWTTH